MKRVFFTFVILFLSFKAFSIPITCFDANVAISSILQNRFFENDANIALVKKMQLLSDGVISVELSAEEKIVLRVEHQGESNDALYNSLKFENFAVTFIDKFYQKVPIPRPVRISDGFKARILELYGSKPSDAPEIKAYLNGQKPLIASAISFYQLEVGEDYLERTIGLKLREMISSVRRVGRVKLEAVIAKTPSEAIDTVVKDLQSSFPNKNFTKENFLEVILSIDSTTNRSEFEAFQNAAFLRLPPTLRGELADYYTLSVVLGIIDFHSLNWLTDGHSAVVIDLANQSQIFNKGISDFSNSFEIAFPVGSISGMKRQLDLVKPFVSPELKKQLAKFNMRDLLLHDLQTKFSLDGNQIAGVLGRRDFVLRSYGP